MKTTNNRNERQKGSSAKNDRQVPQKPVKAKPKKLRTIEDWQKEYKIAWKDGNFKKMRVANDSANAIRKKTGQEHYSSQVGDKQRYKGAQAERDKAFNEKPKPYFPSTARVGVKSNAKQQEMKENQVKNDLKSSFVRANAGAFDGLVPANVKLLGVDDKVKNTAAYKGGKIVGVMGQFAIPYMGAGKAVTAGAKAIMPGAVRGLETIGAKAASIVPKVGAETAEKFGKSAASALVKDVAIGLPLNVNYAFNKEELRGKDAMKSIALNTALDFGVGGVIETLPIAKAVLKNTKGDKVPVVGADGKVRYERQSTAVPTPDNVKSAFGAASVKEHKRIADESRRFMTQVDHAMNGKLNPRSSLIVGKTPKILQDYGANPHMMTIRQNDINKIAYPSGYLGQGQGHNLGFEALRLLPQQLNNPVAILKSSSQDNSLVVFTKMIDANDNPIMVALHLDKKGRIGISNNVASMYGKDGFENFIQKERSAGNVVYENKKMGLNQLPASGLQLPRVEVESDPIFNISKNNENVNMVEQKNKKETENKKGDEQVLNMPKGLQPTPEAPVVSTPLNSTIPPTNSHVNVENAGQFKGLGADVNRIKSTTRENIDAYGKIEPGEILRDSDGKLITRTDVEIPRATAHGEVQEHVRTLRESQIVGEQLAKEIDDAILQGSFTRGKKSNTVAVENASRLIETHGVDEAYDGFKFNVDGKKATTSEDIALGNRLLQELQKNGDYERALDVATDLSGMLSEVGRSLQAARIVKRLSPEGRVILVQRTAEKMSKHYGGDVTVPPQVIEDISRATSEADIVKANKTAAKALWDQVPATRMDKTNAWRYMAMLTNPKTHFRNIIGNSIFVPTRKLKNVIGAGLERAAKVKVGDRTKAILTRKDYDLVEYARNDFANVEGIMKNEGKYSDGTRELEAKVFETKWLEKIRKFNMNALDFEDTLFMKNAYKDSLAQWMKSNKIAVKDMTEELLEKGRDYAMNEALKATYRDANTFAEAISRTKHKWWDSDNKKKKAVSIAMEGAMPFTKTPMNILKRGVEYSPVSIVNGVMDLQRSLKAGESPTKALDKLAAGLAGTSIVALGAYLGSMGIAKGFSNNPYSSKSGKYEAMTGEQEYSLNVGGYSYTIDWAAPVSMPFFIGVELQKVLSKEGYGFGNIVDSIVSIGEPLLNLSMLQGVNEMAKTGFEDKAMFSVVENALTSYAGQFVPTFFGQVARTIDSTRRSTTSTSDSKTGRQGEGFINKQVAKIPIASRLLEPNVDLWGREEKKEGWKDYLSSGLQNFVSPGYVKKTTNTPVDDEIMNLAKDLDEETANKLYPSATNNYNVNISGEDYRMNEKELTEFKRVRGQEAFEGIDALRKTDKYKAMSKEKKVEAATKVYDKAREKARENFARSKGISPVKLLSEKVQTKYDEVKGDISDEEFYTAYSTQRGSKSDVQRALAIEKSGIEKKNVMYKTMEISDESRLKAKIFERNGLSDDDYMKSSEAVKDVEGLKYSNGKTIPLSAAYLKKLAIDKAFSDYDTKKKMALYYTFGVSEQVWGW